MNHAEGQMDITGTTEEYFLQQCMQKEKGLRKKQDQLSEAKEERLKLEEKIKNTLECKVCFHSYDKQKKAPRYLGCHTVCEECLKGFLENKRVPVRQAMGLPTTNFPPVDIKCPGCRRDVIFLEGKTERLVPLNKAIMVNIDMLQNETPRNPSDEPTSAETYTAFSTLGLLRLRYGRLSTEVSALEHDLIQETKQVKSLKSKVESALTCPLCLEEMDAKNKPIILKSCGHTICSQCVKEPFDNREPCTDNNYCTIKCNVTAKCRPSTCYNSLVTIKTQSQNFELNNLH